MSDPALLDTHTLIWLFGGDPALGRRSHELAEAAALEGRLFVAATTFWEITMLVQHGRLALDEAPTAFRRRTLDSGVAEVPLTGDIGIAAAELAGFHGDPADRIITATALARGATLITSDRRILGWPGSLTRQDARG